MDELIAFLHARLDETGRDPAVGAALTRFTRAVRAILATAEKQPGWHLHSPDEHRDQGRVGDTRPLDDPDH